MGDYILTFSKIKFYPLEPVMEDISMKDIAHALSLMTRANGHFAHFYSVAQHSINCFREAEYRGYTEKIQLACLLHDASESYISDITRPVKQNLPQYHQMEEKLQGMIYKKFGIDDLDQEEEQVICEIDDAMLYYEFLELMGYEIFDTTPSIITKPDFSERSFLSVEEEFLLCFHQLKVNSNEISIC